MIYQGEKKMPLMKVKARKNNNHKSESDINENQSAQK